MGIWWRRHYVFTSALGDGSSDEVGVRVYLCVSCMIFWVMRYLPITSFGCISHGLRLEKIMQGAARHNRLLIDL